MDVNDSPLTSESANTPLQDESVINIEEETPHISPSVKQVDDLVDEQLDYEEFEESNGEMKSIEKENGEISEDEVELKEKLKEKSAEIEDGEYESDESITKVTKDIEPKKEIPEVHEKFELSAVKETLSNEDKPENNDFDVIIQSEHIESPWERGLRLARERRQLTVQKKVQEKDKLKEKQKNINLNEIKEVELIFEKKPLQMNKQLLSELQPIVVLPEEPKPNELILEYYLSESDYQHRTRFVPSKLYTLDPWEVEEWKRELDEIKCELEANAALSYYAPQKSTQNLTAQYNGLPSRKPDLSGRNENSKSNISKSRRERDSSSASSERLKTKQTVKTVKKPALGLPKAKRGKTNDGHSSSDDESSSSSGSDSSDSDSASSSGSSDLSGSDESDSSSDSSAADGETNKARAIKSQGKSTKALKSSVGKSNDDKIATAKKSHKNEDSNNLPINGSNNKENKNHNLPSAESRPGVKLKLINKNKPIVVQPNSNVDGEEDNQPLILSKPSKTSAHTISKIDELAASSSTQLEMQKEFLRTYKDKIAIYRATQQQKTIKSTSGHIIGVGGGGGGSALHPHQLRNNNSSSAVGGAKGHFTTMNVVTNKKPNLNDNNNNTSTTYRNRRGSSGGPATDNQYQSSHNNNRRGRSRSRSPKSRSPRYNNNNNNRGFNNRDRGFNNRDNRNFNNYNRDKDSNFNEGGGNGRPNYNQRYNNRDGKDNNRDGGNFGRDNNRDGGNYGRDNNRDGGNYGRDNNRDGGNYGRDNNRDGGNYGRDNNREGGNYGRDNNREGGNYGRDNNRESGNYGHGNYGRDNNRDNNFGRDNNRDDNYGRNNRDGGNYGRNNRDVGNYGRDNNYDRDNNQRDQSYKRRTRDTSSSPPPASKMRYEKQSSPGFFNDKSSPEPVSTTTPKKPAVDAWPHSFSDSEDTANNAASASNTTAPLSNHNKTKDELPSSNMSNTASVNPPVNNQSGNLPKEKRREELLKQLKAVEDAIAKKRAKIDK